MKNRLIIVAALISAFLNATIAIAVPPPKGYDIDRILNAIRVQESAGQKNPNEAVGDNGASLGSYQISRAYWKDALKQDPSIGGKYEDVKKPEYARRVIIAYLTMYIKTSEEWTDERVARLHNGGPNWKNKPSTKTYWRSVKAIIENGGKKPE